MPTRLRAPRLTYCGIPDHLAMCDPAYVGFIQKAWHPLKQRYPFLAGETLEGSTLESVAQMRAALARLDAEHDTNIVRADAYTNSRHHRVDGEVRSRFNPKSLPPKHAIVSLATLDAAAGSLISSYSPTAPRKLSEIRRHTKYHEQRARLEAFDAKVDAATNTRVGTATKAIRRRELTRFVSCSLPLAGKWKSDSTPHRRQQHQSLLLPQATPLPMSS